MAESTAKGPTADEKSLLSSSADSFNRSPDGPVGYLGAKQLPCSEKFPTFDIGPRCAHLRYILRFGLHTMSEHESDIYWLKVELRDQANKALTLEHLTLPPSSKEFLSHYEAIVRGLEEKAGSWEQELERLQDEIRVVYMNTPTDDENSD